MVCLGNICRSPLAEGLLSSKVDHAQVKVDSAGTSGFHEDETPDVRMIKTARRHGINLSHLRGRQFTQRDFQDFDHIYVMDQSNYKNVMELAQSEEERRKVDLILNQISPGGNASVPDPYYGGDEGFENVFRLLDAATDQIAEKLKDGKL